MYSCIHSSDVFIINYNVENKSIEWEGVCSDLGLVLCMRVLSFVFGTLATCVNVYNVKPVCHNDRQAHTWTHIQYMRIWGNCLDFVPRCIHTHKHLYPITSQVKRRRINGQWGFVSPLPIPCHPFWKLKDTVNSLPSYFLTIYFNVATALAIGDKWEMNNSGGRCKLVAISWDWSSGLPLCFLV